ncbi:fasciclin domain-containing protein [Aurantibacter sp.]|uniref:fasciclin domain-containing protein n=1 Tax=Aurantibacter sp. TaxID=2807103 RepID=UPI0035C847E5
MIIIKRIILVLYVLVAFNSCSSDDNATTTTQTKNIIETAQDVPELSILVEAVIQADLLGALIASGDKTVFAPTNAAFEQFLMDNGFAALSDVPDAVLTQVLLNHVIDGSSLASTDLAGSTGYANTLADGPNNTKLSIFYNGNNGVTLNGISTVSTPNVNTTNGIVHIVNTVIGLPDVVTFATADPNFSILVDALTRETSFTYVSTLQTDNGTSPAPFTVFAPTNLAFAELLTELNYNTLGDIPTSTLSATLDTHVITGNNYQDTAFQSGTTYNTLGGDLTFTSTTDTTTLTDENDRVSNIIATNVQATNGVIHVIDKVVLPPLT